MGMMFGFGRERRQQLELEFARMAGELPALGALRILSLEDFLAREQVLPSDGLDLVVVLQTGEPYHRRADFLTSHLRPRVGTRFLVYTPDEYEELRDSDPVIRRALAAGRVVDEPA